MKYRLIAVDIDGTLVDSGGNLTEATRSAVRAAVEKGVIFTISTGRPVQGVEYLNDMLGLDVPFITYNGAMVVMGKSREIIYERGLSAKDAKEIFDLGKGFGTTMTAWSDNKLYVNEMNDRVHHYKKITGVEPILIDDIDSLARKGITKFLWIDEIEKIEHYQDTVGKSLGDGVNFHTSRPTFLEFVDRKASKAIAMEKLGEHFGIGREEMIAVGDGFNDLSMIEYAGLGVAMGNSKDAIKERADYVTLTNDEDGVAHVIRKFILDQEAP